MPGDCRVTRRKGYRSRETAGDESRSPGMKKREESTLILG